MSRVEVQLVEGVFSADQKQGIIADVTETLLKYEGEGARNNTMVVITEVKSGDWGRGGVGLTADAILSASRSPA